MSVLGKHQLRVVFGVSALIAVSIGVPALAAPLHPEGTLKLEDRTLVPATTVQVGGEKFHEGGTLHLVLVGVTGRIPLGEVTADSVGAFTTAVALPADLEIGAYRLVAVATDGDEVASLDVELVAPPEEPRAEHEHPEMAEPTAEPLALDRADSAWVTGGALIGIVLALVAAGVLLYKPQGSAWSASR
jgi:hypothetical protein